MNHKVNNVQRFHDDIVAMKNNIVSNGESSADAIIDKLDKGIRNLKTNWKGKDASRRINEVVSVYNALVDLRNNLSDLCVASSKVVADYREIQNANGAGLETFSTLSSEIKTKISEFFDDMDTVDINDDVLTGKELIDSANDLLDSFAELFRGKYAEIMENWTAGSQREKAQQAFDSFNNNLPQFKQILADASNNIKIAIANYGSGSNNTTNLLK